MLAIKNYFSMLKDLVQNDVWITTKAGVPVDGLLGTGARLFGKGTLYVDKSTGIWYSNTGTRTSPVWTKVGTQV